MISRGITNLKKKQIAILIITIIIIFLMAIIGPVDYFKHGYFCNEIAYDQIPKENFIDYIDLKNNSFKIEFSLEKKHFKGFEINITNHPENNKGFLYLTIYDNNNKQIDEIVVDISKVKAGVWYKTYINENLNKGKKYTLNISAKNCDTYPYLQIVDSKYVSNETISGNLLIGYAYAVSTFNFQNKVLIFLFFIAIYTIIFGKLILTEEKGKICIIGAIFILMITVLSWNYMYNSMDNQNTSFATFQGGSEALVINPMIALENNIWFDSKDQLGYGLGRYPDGKLKAYKSQYGLQGKIFRHLAIHTNGLKTIESFHLLCALSTAIVFICIVFLIFKKYNFLLALCFFITFWLSPWIVNFARNLYWVEFTWFLPMLIGLFLSLKIESIRYRIICYLAIFISITVKCLCGYEYISTIMIGLIAFLFIDLVKAVIDKNREKSFLIFKTIFIVGIVALIGFIVAILIHANLRGVGNIKEGVKQIFQEDILRRTYATDLNQFEQIYWDSLNASAWEVYCKYFKFSTQIITGIPGNLFPYLCIIPICIFCIDYEKHRLNVAQLTMYAIFFLAPITWFYLAKSHSYIHTHMNYVLWYFGFVQICFYTIINKILSVLKIDAKINLLGK